MALTEVVKAVVDDAVTQGKDGVRPSTHQGTPPRWRPGISCSREAVPKLTSPAARPTMRRTVEQVVAAEAELPVARPEAVPEASQRYHAHTSSISPSALTEVLVLRPT